MLVVLEEPWEFRPKRCTGCRVSPFLLRQLVWEWCFAPVTQATSPANTCLLLVAVPERPVRVLYGCTAALFWKFLKV